MKIQTKMTAPVKTCIPTDTLALAAQLMWESDCGSLPVVDVAGAPIGMITDRDICMAAYTQGERLDAIAVGIAMSRSVYTCRATDALTTAEATMRLHQVRRLPVIDDDGHLVGIVSLSDFARNAHELTGVLGVLGSRDALGAQAILHTLIAVSARVPEVPGVAE
jgi:CBS domain-containing protein